MADPFNFLCRDPYIPPHLSHVGWPNAMITQHMLADYFFTPLRCVVSYQHCKTFESFYQCSTHRSDEALCQMRYHVWVL